VNYYALFYRVVDDYMEKRPLYRPYHLQHAQAAQERGELMLGGAFSDPPDSALLVFQAADKSVVEAFAQNDPYVLNGLVVHWEVRIWTVVIGTACEPLA
jgi:uncharacterized protein YciI